jgi:metallo-beta-lactamase class B
MKRSNLFAPVVYCLITAPGGLIARSQTAPDTAEAHRALAKAAAGTDLTGIYDAACPTPQPAGAGRGPGRGRGPRPTPAREEWYNEPAKVFDNLYFLGTKVHESWAVTTSDGIIVIDALYGYAAEAEITDGMKKLGLDPAKIKYVIVSHGHGDHSGGAKYLQDTYHARIILSPADWDLLARDPNNATVNPKRDMEATDGQKLTLGDTTLTLYITPGHTGGTISTLIPVKEGGKPHLAVEWGGTVISPSSPVEMLQAYVKSAQRFRDLATGGDVILTNHTAFDGTLLKNAALLSRKPGDPNPWIVGKETVQRYLTVAEECGKANLITAQSGSR